MTLGAFRRRVATTTLSAVPDDAAFREPDLDAPLDAATELERIPSSATISGVFLAGVVEAAKERGIRLPHAQESYIDFRPYPLRDHARLLVDAAGAYYPDERLRRGLLRLGRGAPQTLLRSMIGRVVLGSVEGPLEALAAMAKSYPLHTKPGSLEVEPVAPGRAIVRLREIHHFLDPHHVGVFEGVLRFAGVEGTVRIHALSRSDADLLCEWFGPRTRSTVQPR